MELTGKWGIVSLSVSSPDGGLSPQTTPLGEIGEYCKKLSQLLSGREIKETDLLFDDIVEGCTCISIRTAKTVQISAMLPGLTDEDYAPLLESLKKHGRYAELAYGDFKKELLPEPDGDAEYEIFQEEVFRGEVIRIGGKDHTVPFTLRTDNGELHLNLRDRDTAVRMAAHLFQYIECSGSGWLRLGKDGFRWLPVPKKFYIDSFTVLEDDDDWLERFQAVDSDWRRVQDPMALLDEMRKD